MADGLRDIPPYPSSFEGLESLRGRRDPKAIRAAATEMEAVFVNEMLKAMRKTLPEQTGGLGGAIYTSLFDMEVSRLVAQRGIGLKEAIIRELEGTARMTAIDVTSSVQGPQVQPEADGPSQGQKGSLSGDAVAVNPKESSLDTR